MRLLFTLDLV